MGAAGFPAGTPNAPAAGPTVFGNTYDAYKETDGGLFLPPSQIEIPGAGGGTWTLTRNANGQFYNALTAAAATAIISVGLNRIAFAKTGADPINPGLANIPETSGHDIRGVQLTGVQLLYTLGTANMTSITPAFWRNVYSDNIAVPTPTTLGGTLSPANFPVVQRTNMYAQTITLGTPFVVGNNAVGTEDVMELTIVNPGTSVFRLYGINFLFNYNIL